MVTKICGAGGVTGKMTGLFRVNPIGVWNVVIVSAFLSLKRTAVSFALWLGAALATACSI